MRTPRIFVGSSNEGLPIAEAVQLRLEPPYEVELWTQGVYGLTQGNLENLLRAVPTFDFAILVLTADDLKVSRGDTTPAARDNVVFELGVFLGALGPDRTFMVYDRTRPPSLPSDLSGVAAATFQPHANGNLDAALGSPSTKIKQVIAKVTAAAGAQQNALTSGSPNSLPPPGKRFDEMFDWLVSHKQTKRN